MNLFSHFLNEIEHDAKPLLLAAAQWAEKEGMTLVRELEAEVQSKGLIPLFNETLGATLGFTIPAGATLAAEAVDLLTTALARNKAQAVSGANVRASVLNAGVEQAVLLVKGQIGDTATVPPPNPVVAAAAPAPAASTSTAPA